MTKVVIKQDVNDVTYLFPNAINLKRIEFESTTPPDVNDLDNTLAEMQKHAYDDDCFIIVPKGSEMNYMNHPFWYRFLVKSSDSVADISSDEMKVTVDGRMVRIAGIDEKRVLKWLMHADKLCIRVLITKSRCLRLGFTLYVPALMSAK